MRLRRAMEETITMALAFPDVYKVGMSHLRLKKILYSIVNSRPKFYEKHTFAPWPDMEHLMRKEGKQPTQQMKQGPPCPDT